MNIRKGQKEDLKKVYDLIVELAVFENARDQVKTSIQEMEENAFGSNPVFGFHVAENNEGIVGMSLYYFRYSTWKGKLLYIEDLVVTEKYRRSGVGTKLMEATIEEAKSRNCKGVSWQVLEWNKPAIDFYKKYDPVLDGEWINFRISKDQFDSYSSSS